MVRPNVAGKSYFWRGRWNSKRICISGDFEHILDLLELNRIFPLLDKKLV